MYLSGVYVQLHLVLSAYFLIWDSNHQVTTHKTAFTGSCTAIYAMMYLPAIQRQGVHDALHVVFFTAISARPIKYAGCVLARFKAIHHCVEENYSFLKLTTKIVHGPLHRTNMAKQLITMALICFLLWRRRLSATTMHMMCEYTWCLYMQMVDKGLSLDNDCAMILGLCQTPSAVYRL